MLTTPPPPATDHATEARALLDLTIQSPRDDGDFTAAGLLAFAQVHAMLAVAEQTTQLATEQRTANLLTYLELVPPHSATRDRLLDEIHARLDPAIDEDVTP